MSPQITRRSPIFWSIFALLFACGAALLPTETAFAAKTKNLIELTGVNPRALSEKDLYIQVIEKYRASDAVGLKARVQLLSQKYPKSVFADNALYLTGRLAFEQKRYAEAVSHYNELLKKYPNSNKAVSARYSKGMTYLRMNLPRQGSTVLQEVMRTNPGSFEAARAKSELKLMPKVSSKKNRPTVTR